jgi:hypothetical protein
MGRMKKPISPRAHGLIDYALVAGNLITPQLISASTKARAVFGAFGAMQGSVNALTQQPYAIRKLIPFRVHRIIDISTLPLFVLLPLVTGVTKDPRVRAYWINAGIILVALFALTDWDAKRPGK